MVALLIVLGTLVLILLLASVSVQPTRSRVNTAWAGAVGRAYEDRKV